MRSTGNHDDDVRRAAVRQALGALAGLLEIGIVAVDPEGRCWFRSQRWQDRSGTGGDAFHGHPWYEGVHPDDRDDVAVRWRALLGRPGRLGTFRTIGIDGLVRRCRAESIPMVGVDGRRDGHLIVITDPVEPESGEARDDGAAGAAGGGDEGGAAGPPGALTRRARAGGGRTLPTLSTSPVLDAVLAGSPDVITIFNEDGSWRWSSGAALRLLGHQAEFAAEDGLVRLLHPEDVEVAMEAFARAVAGELAPDERFEVRVWAADGTWRSLEGYIDVLLDDPTVHGVVVHTRDVTDRRQVMADLEASNRRLADVIGSMESAILVEDEHGDVVLVNDAFVDLFRLPATPERLVGRRLEEFGFTVDALVVDPPGAAGRVRDVRARGRRVSAARAVLFDGRTIELDFVPTRAQGNDRGRLWAIRDVSRQARAEAERERLLASEREENRRLAEMDAYRSESIAIVSHELRTPLTSIVGYAQLLRNMIDPAQRPEEAECLDAISRNVGRLLRLAGDVLALDSLESRTLPLEVATVDLAQTLHQSAATVAPEARAKSITVDVEMASGPPLHGDSDRLVQLFDNLLSNAVKFTPNGGRIVVAGRAAGGEWLIEVADTGIGIPGDEMELLFGRFFRASNARTRGIPGSGLGLSVARAIAERHRGSISVQSVFGKGTTVTVRLRDAPEHGVAAGGGAGAGAGADRAGAGNGAGRGGGAAAQEPATGS